MRNFDLTPMHRATVGFDQITDLMDRVLRQDVSQPSYPPYNIEKTGDDAWRISLAVAGFATDDIVIEQRENAVIIAARKADEDTSEKTYLHRGIATRSFERRFHLADHVKVVEASHENGMLHVDLLREVPEALKPRRIEIASTPVLEAEKAVEKKTLS
ncbi:molecular chaperone IbpA [Pacificibacter maritimus]|uniref:Molecular chaperone IbpA n=1 Tax=Pacificibacter maritimus TaxID=762213 RepID=A0A3N4UQB0_9RHOB|nr:Hsp20 family protein [Pacificibacter maritimus]RPE67177.1 molecular chaperone IbpA [Pacificibacter maritimus]